MTDPLHRRTVLGSALVGATIHNLGKPVSQSLLANETSTAATEFHAKRQRTIDKGIQFLRGSQNKDGSFGNQAGPGITGVVLAGIVAAGVPESDPLVAKSVEHLLSTRRENGGLFSEGSRHANYETSLAILAFLKLNDSGEYDDLIGAASVFLKKEQWDEGEGLTSDDMRYGGAGYGNKSRPDLSNTSFLIEALRESGTSADDPAIQRALAFVSRCQNLDSAHNDTEFASKVNDGGFYYTIANNGESPAGIDESTGALRSYGSMSYAGLKSMIYAGVTKDDVRVKAVENYLRKNYAVSSNPGMGATGLYYYLQMMSKTLAILGEPIFESDSGPKNWKSEILEQLVRTQQEDGSWVNETVRWMENDANLVTGYTLLTLGNLK